MTYELAALVKDQVLPVLEDSGVKTIFVTCGNTSQVKAWQETSGYPTDRSYLDQKGVFYDGLRTRRGVWRTFRPDYWIIGPLRRLLSGDFGFLWRAIRGYRLTVPKDKAQGWLQGGVFIFSGRQLLWAHYAATPEDHGDWKQVIRVAKESVAAKGGKTGQRVAHEGQPLGSPGVKQRQ